MAFEGKRKIGSVLVIGAGIGGVQASLDLADSGYHFMIDINGNIYEGRDLRVRGAHTGGFNTGAVGVVLIGDFSGTKKPSDKQVKALKALTASLSSSFGIRCLGQHRHFNATDCPGGEETQKIINDIQEVFNMGSYHCIGQ